MVTNTLPYPEYLLQEEQTKNLRKFYEELESLEEILCDSRVRVAMMRDTRPDTDPREFVLNLWSLDTEILKLHEKIASVKTLINEILKE